MHSHDRVLATMLSLGYRLVQLQSKNPKYHSDYPRLKPIHLIKNTYKYMCG